MQSSLSVPLAAALRSADALVTGVFAVAGWLLVKYLDLVNARFNSVDARFNAVDARFNAVDARLSGVEDTLQELKSLLSSPR